MKTIQLLRHGKSGWGDAGLEDHERPLAPRGIAAAQSIGRLLNERGWLPDALLCSSARRTQETLAELIIGFGPGLPQARIESELYLASAAGLVERLQSLPDEIGVAMIIGHNDGMHICAQSLAGAGESRDLSRLASGFPTAGLAIIQMEIDHWSDLRSGKGRLAHLVFPREID